MLTGVNILIFDKTTPPLLWLLLEDPSYRRDDKYSSGRLTTTSKIQFSPPKKTQTELSPFAKSSVRKNVTVCAARRGKGTRRHRCAAEAAQR